MNNGQQRRPKESDHNGRNEYGPVGVSSDGGSQTTHMGNSYVEHQYSKQGLGFSNEV